MQQVYQAKDWAWLYEIFEQGVVFGLDTETVNCNPLKESPVGKAKIWCVTLAWKVKDDYSGLFIYENELGVLREFLENDKYKKVGANIFGYDYHVFANHGIALSGIAGDTVRMSRLLDPSKLKGHSLKEWGYQLKYDITKLGDICKRPKPGAMKIRKDGVESQNVSFRTWEKMNILDFVKDYPHKEHLVKAYALQDAEMSLAVYNRLKEKLTQLAW
jgi:DNA polymerase I-like protein with 3'-5' exonuclease and polymerase domains